MTTGRRDWREGPWAVAAVVGVFAAPTLDAALAWAGVLFLGASVAQRVILRWIALAWCAAALVPPVPLAPSAASGAALRHWRGVMAAAATGLIVGSVLPRILCNGTVLLLLAAFLSAALRRPQ